MIRLFLTICVLVGIFVLLISKGVLWFVYPDRDLYPLRGIDVSHHKGSIDWEKVASDDVSFAFIKATEGDDFVDSSFISNWNSAREQKIPVGAYHFYSLRFEGAMQAQNFIKTVPIASGSLPPVVDLEYGGNSKQRPPREDFQKELRSYLEMISEHYGKTPILYTTYDFYHDYLEGAFNEYPLWIRDLFKTPKDTLPWQFWQYKNRGHIDGIEGYVDLNVFRGLQFPRDYIN